MKKMLLAMLVIAPAAFAEPPVIDDVRITQTGDTWRFDVTISHPDTGWDHYADAWRILDMNGTQLGIRELAHPHVDEQPFTRSLSGVRLPAGTTQVVIQARDKPGGWNANTTTVTVP